MAFTKKTWENRVSEYPNRRTLTMEDGSTETVLVVRDEGTIENEGDAFSEANMNDLEDRIEAEFVEVNSNLSTIYQIQTVTFSISIAASSAGAFYWNNPTISGYDYVGVIGYHTGSTYLYALRIASGRMDVTNTSSSALSVTGSATLLYIRNS